MKLSGGSRTKKAAVSGSGELNRGKRSMKRHADAVIIGGGASGLAAAIELGLKEPSLSVLIIEKMDEPGHKLRATGSGRCNISNTRAEGYERIMEFFARIGLSVRVYDNGLVYPYSESASDVVKLLAGRAAALGVKLACREEVVSIKKIDDQDLSNEASGNVRHPRFRVESEYMDKNGRHRIVTEADYVFLACGGKAGPTYGTTGDGYRLAREFGHSIVTPVPALTGIECKSATDGFVLAGIRTRGIVSLYKCACASHNNRDSLRTVSDASNASDSSDVCVASEVSGSSDEICIFREEGEIQFTRYGLSGICVFNMTRHMRYDRTAGESLSDFVIRADLYPGRDISGYIRERQRGCFSDEPVRDMLCGILKEPLAKYVLDSADGIIRSGKGRTPDPADRTDRSGMKRLSEKKISGLTESDISAIASCTHSLEFHPSSIRGWKDAQVTMGGVSMDEIDEKTSASRLTDGLYITGELADRDFPCGGYNLSNAWITGLAAADDAARDAAASHTKNETHY